MKAAAAGMRLDVEILKAAKAGGCPAFSSNRVHEQELRDWLQAHPEVAKAKITGYRMKIDKERYRKLTLENDENEKRLVPRAWVAERMQLAAGKVDAFRQKSEAEHPLLFAAAAGDVPACRAVVCRIWDEVIASLNSLKTEFRQ